MRVAGFAGILLRAASADTLAFSCDNLIDGKINRQSHRSVQKGRCIPAVVERALSEGLHPAGWDFILRRPLRSR